ncbi:KTSC domain-containing protein (plasmid) [Devosia sp. A8/3-2]|nr:KTSC domain-containing protein [Devosia sp. A8/3-2]
MPSSLIEKSDYNPDTRVLSVWLVTNGNRYDYQNVSPETYGAFRATVPKAVFSIGESGPILVAEKAGPLLPDTPAGT